jgi:hypothetical protein
VSEQRITLPTRLENRIIELCGRGDVLIGDKEQDEGGAAGGGAGTEPTGPADLIESGLTSVASLMADIAMDGQLFPPRFSGVFLPLSRLVLTLLRSCLMTILAGGGLGGTPEEHDSHRHAFAVWFVINAAGAGLPPPQQQAAGQQQLTAFGQFVCSSGGGDEAGDEGGGGWSGLGQWPLVCSFPRTPAVSAAVKRHA